MPINALQVTNNSVQIQKQNQDYQFYLKNWKKVLSRADSYLAKIRVIGKIASIIDGKIIIRCPLNLPDGFYLITRENEFRPEPAKDMKQPWKAYPDAGCYEPPFENMHDFTKLSKENILGLIRFTEEARIANCLSINFHPQGFVYRSNNQEFYFRHEMKLQSQLLIDPENLVLSLKEMLRYDFVSMFVESWDAKSPLIIGHNWRECVLIKPVFNEYSYGQSYRSEYFG